MNLEIRSHDLTMTDGLRSLVRERVEGALGRFGDHVRSVRVQLTDLNGPRGGVDIRCRIQARLRIGRELIVQETRETPLSAVGHATDAVRYAIARRLGRFRNARRRQVRFRGVPVG